MYNRIQAKEDNKENVKEILVDKLKILNNPTKKSARALLKDIASKGATMFQSRIGV